MKFGFQARPRPTGSRSGPNRPAELAGTKAGPIAADLPIAIRAAASSAIASAAAAAAAAAAGRVAVAAAGSKRVREDNETKPKKEVSIGDAFGEAARAEAEAAETAEAEEAVAQTRAAKRPRTAADRRATAEDLRVQGQASASRGDFESALLHWERGLVALHGGPRSCVASVSSSEVASTAIPGVITSAQGDRRLASAPLGLDDDAKATNLLRAKLHESRAQVFLLLPERADSDLIENQRCGGGEYGSQRCHGGSPLQQAANAAEASTAAAPLWAPGWLTLGRTLLALGLGERARRALAEAAKLDESFFQSEGGSADAADATRLIVQACVKEAAAEIAVEASAEVAKDASSEGPVVECLDDVRSSNASDDGKWRVRIVDGKQVFEPTVSGGSED